MRRVVLAAALALLSSAASAQTVVNLASPTGNVGMGDDGASHLLALNAMCGATSATLWTACANQVEVNSSGQLLVNVGNSILQVQSNSANLATQTTLASVLSALASPFQAGGSIGNSGFNALQAGSANVLGNPFFVQVTNTLTAVGNNADGVAPTSGAGSPVIDYLFGFDGTNWDRLQVDGSKNLKVNLATALPAGTNLLGKVGIDQTTPGTTNGVQVNAALPAGTNNIGQVSPTTYPATAVPLTASATGTTAATTATLTNVSGHTTYICGFSIRANATAAATGNATVTGTITATMNFTQWTAPLASGLGVTEETFSPCVPASAVSTSIAVVSAAPGSGGVVSVSAWGYSI